MGIQDLFAKKTSKENNVNRGYSAPIGGADFGNDAIFGNIPGDTPAYNPNKPSSASNTPAYDPNATTTTSSLPTYHAPDASKGELPTYKAPTDTYVSPSKRADYGLPTYVPNKHNTVQHKDTYISPDARNNEEGMSTYVVTKHNTVEHEDNYIPLAERNKMSKMPTYKTGPNGSSGATIVNPNHLAGGFGNDSDDDFNSFMNSYDS